MVDNNEEIIYYDIIDVVDNILSLDIASYEEFCQLADMIEYNDLLNMEKVEAAYNKMPDNRLKAYLTKYLVNCLVDSSVFYVCAMHLSETPGIYSEKDIYDRLEPYDSNLYEYINATTEELKDYDQDSKILLKYIAKKRTEILANALIDAKTLGDENILDAFIVAANRYTSFVLNVLTSKEVRSIYKEMYKSKMERFYPDPYAEGIHEEYNSRIEDEPETKTSKMAEQIKQMRSEVDATDVALGEAEHIDEKITHLENKASKMKQLAAILKQSISSDPEYTEEPTAYVR